MPLTHDIARRMIAASEEKARELNIAIATAILDSEGRLFAFSRMDGAGWTTVEVSQAKAFASAVFRRDGTEMGQFAPTSLAALATAYGRGIMPLGSATVVLEGDAVMAAIGCSGAPTDELDADCAHAARDAARS